MGGWKGGRGRSPAGILLLGGEGESNYNNSFKRLVLHTVPMKNKKKGRGWERDRKKKEKEKKKKKGTTKSISFGECWLEWSVQMAERAV